jgi:hypothetical protein
MQVCKAACGTSHAANQRARLEERSLTVLEEPFRLRRKERREARHMLHPKTTLQWPETQHEQARRKPTEAAELPPTSKAQATECGKSPWAVQTLSSGEQTCTHMGSMTAQQTCPASAATATRTSSAPALQHLQMAATAAHVCCCYCYCGHV